jgi:glutathione synthase/RimK-type ligase-like ATP-grasp enzyme
MMTGDRHGSRSSDLVIAIVTRAADAHASAVQAAIHERGARCILIEADRLANETSFTFAPAGGATRSGLDGDVDASEIDVVWHRREMREPDVPDAVVDPNVRRLVLTAGRRATEHYIERADRAALVNDPTATRRAENKLVQLDAAAAVGLRLPRTLVSNNPVDIRSFCADCDMDVVAKPLGSARAGYAVAPLDPADLASDEELSLCPSIYQELVAGERHLRICVFGGRIVTIALDAPMLDWRFESIIPASPAQVDPVTAARLRALLDHLGLRMGIVDMKYRDGEPEPFFFEVNPQGQFLFLEEFTDQVHLLETFVDFLLDEAMRARSGWSATAAR